MQPAMLYDEQVLDDGESRACIQFVVWSLHSFCCVEHR